MEDQEFGGDWTEKKLDKIRKYLPAYMKILSKRKELVTGYIDAFAGTGYRYPPADCPDEPDLFEEFTAPDIERYREGSARIALSTNPPFDKYIFIEKEQTKCQALEKLKSEFPDRGDRIQIINQDANLYISKMCSPEKDWSTHRAVMFLDPFGMQVNWDTVELIASTKAIDLWYLFPIGAVNRLLERKGRLPSGFPECLNRALGSADWQERFYEHITESDLFGPVENVVKKGSFNAIGEYVLERLGSIFAGVVPAPYFLKNSRNSPLFMLCFAVGNPRAADTAIKIARDVMKD